MPLSSESMLLMMVEPDLGQVAGIDDGGVHLSSLIVSGHEIGTNTMLCFTHWHGETLFPPPPPFHCRMYACSAQYFRRCFAQMGLLQLLKPPSFISPFTCAGETTDQFTQRYLYTEPSHICLSKQQLSMQIRGANKTFLGSHTWPIQSIKSQEHLTPVWNLLQQKKASEVSDDSEI